MLQKVYIHVQAHTGFQLRFISDFELNLQYFGYLKKTQDE